MRAVAAPVDGERVTGEPLGERLACAAHGDLRDEPAPRVLHDVHPLERDLRVARARGDDVGDLEPLQLRLEDLAHRGGRHRLENPHVLGHRRALGNRVRGEREQRGLVGARARLQLDVRDGQLARVRVRAADRRGERDGRMGGERVLDDPRIDVVPAADDQLLLAADEPEIAVRVAPAEVARVQPPLARDVDPQAALVRRIEVAAKHVRPRERDQPDFVDERVAHVAPGVVDDHRAHALVGQAQADRADAPLAVERVERRDARALGQPVALDDLHAGRALEAARELDGHRRRAARRVFERADVVPADRLLQQRGEKRRHAGKRIDPISLDDRPEARDHVLAAVALRRAEHDMMAAQPRHQAGDELAVHVKERQPAEHRARALVVARLRLARRPHVEHLGAVRAHRDLRAARRAARAEVRRRLVGPDRARPDQPVARLPAHLGVQIDDAHPRAAQARLLAPLDPRERRALGQ
ncbi:Uncharacterised protein [Burkholderia pseudomallei]|nr:Uncharacterised protein [Burkholderia pseudomallei]CAJ5088990.1 Uncharacterised protein [Burkholderia pseudomallei]CAJ9714312.1 Uncharacterised protein [Burkholderia pseudomallei]